MAQNKRKTPAKTPIAGSKRRASEIHTETPSKRTSRRTSITGHEPPPPIQHSSHGTVPGTVFVHGNGDCGQLGLGEDVLERKRPFPLSVGGKKVLQVVAGGMHGAALASDGSVWTWGVNDEGALGRQTNGKLWEAADEWVAKKDTDPYVPVKVALPHRVLHISAGDSHTMTVTESGEVWGWGTFRDTGGVFGFAPGTRIQLVPVRVYHPKTPDMRVAKVSSGENHVLAVTVGGKVLSWGTGQQGQLGRLPARRAGRGDQMAALLIPAPVIFMRKRRGTHATRVADVEAGQYSSFAVSVEGRVEAWGLNNYGQLGIKDGPLIVHAPASVMALADSRVASIAGGTHHSVCVTEEGKALAWGRSTYGGLGRAAADAKSDTASPQPEEVDSMTDCTVVAVAAGANVSAAVDAAGRLHTWGFGDMQQLGTGGDADAVSPVVVPTAGRLAGFKVLQAVLGGQHASLLAVKASDAPPPPSDATALAAAETEESNGDASADGDGDGPEDMEGVVGDSVPVPDPWAAAAAGSAPVTAGTSSKSAAPAADDLWAKLAAASQTARPVSEYLDDGGPGPKETAQPAHASAPAAATITAPAAAMEPSMFGAAPATANGTDKGEPAASTTPAFRFDSQPAATSKSANHDKAAAASTTPTPFVFGVQSATTSNGSRVPTAAAAMVAAAPFVFGAAPAAVSNGGDGTASSGGFKFGTTVDEAAVPSSNGNAAPEEVEPARSAAP